MIQVRINDVSKSLEKVHFAISFAFAFFIHAKLDAFTVPSLFFCLYIPYMELYWRRNEP
jgi:hypothetical protein